SSGVSFRLAVFPSAARGAEMRFTLNAARSKCGASVVPPSVIAMRRKSRPVAIASFAVCILHAATAHTAHLRQHAGACWAARPPHGPTAATTDEGAVPLEPSAPL